MQPFSEAEARSMDGGEGRARSSSRSPSLSVWDVLGIAPDASIDDIKLAFRRRAFETHPDRGGTDEAFRSVVDAHAKATARRKKTLRRPRKRK
jgi:curved DNA-binding protein CbpA